MISGGKPPPAPDPVKTASAQTGMNIDSAVGTQLVNSVNQNTPQGSLTYSTTGYNDYTTTDAKGKTTTYHIPQLTATQAYSPEQQALYDTGVKTQQNIGNIGLDQSQKIGDLLSTPLDLSSTAIDDNLYSRYSPRVQQQQSRQNDAIDAQLAAEGITRGSAAYDDAIRQRDQGNNDQWNSLYLGGRQQAIGEMLQQRQEPINEVNSLLSGSQVTNPAFGQTPTTSIKPADYEGDVYNSYNAQMQAYNAKQSQSNAMMGGIFGTIGSLAGGWAASDRRLKEDLWPVGTLASGVPVYLFRYKGDETRTLYQGVMAQDMLLVDPQAVRLNGDGFYSVNYDRVWH